MRRALVALLVTLALATFAGTAHAKGSKGKGKGMSGSYQGTIVAVAQHDVTIDVGINRPQRIIVAVDDKTEITGGGKKGTLADLAKGQIVTFDVSDNHAKKIEVTGVQKSGE